MFLLGRNGLVLRRYAPQDAPGKLRADIEAALAR
jgi:glutathione peroxidase